MEKQLAYSAETAADWNATMIREGLDKWTTYHVEQTLDLKKSTQSAEQPVKEESRNEPRQEPRMSLLFPGCRLAKIPKGVVYDDEKNDPAGGAVHTSAECMIKEEPNSDTTPDNKNGAVTAKDDLSSASETKPMKLGIFASKRDQGLTKLQGNGFMRKPA